MSEEIVAQEQPKKRGRPKGSKDKYPRKVTVPLSRVDPKTGIVVSNRGKEAVVMGRIGDEKVSAFVQYHLDLLKMRQGVDVKNVPDLYRRFFTYLTYCKEHGVIPGNMNAYLAIGVTKQQISEWHLGTRGTPEHKKFADDVMQFFASVHEQGAVDGLFNPVSGIFWQKAHDGMIEAQKLEVVNNDPLGDKRSAEDIAKRYEGVELPE